MSTRKFFGTDGIRGLVGREPVTPQTVLKLGWAAGCVFSQNLSQTNPAKVIIGKDTRVSGYLLESALEAGFSAAGVDISLLGPMPTPGIAYLTRTARAQAGVVISASHNPYHDNGIKFFSHQGLKLNDEIEHAIENQMEKPMQVVSADRLGKASRFPDAAGRYIEFCKGTIDPRLNLKGLKIVLDCANGAAYHIAPSVFAELGADVTVIANTPDGFNINRECGSTYPEALQNKVIELEADLGIALDGDGDRALMVDDKGDVIDGDQMLFFITKDRVLRQVMRGGVVGTLMSNLGLEQSLANLNIDFVRTQVGDRYIMSRLLSNGWELGGESSGHILCLDKSTTGDGIISALQALQAAVNMQRPLSDIKKDMTMYPQTTLNVPLSDGIRASDFNAENNECVRVAVQDAQQALGGNGRILLRPSGTEPVIRVTVEGEDENLVNRLGKQLAQVVKSTAV